MNRKKAVVALVAVAAVPFCVFACTARAPYEGGGRAFGGSTATVTSDEDTGVPDVPIDTGNPIPDVSIPPDTGPKDGASGG